MLPNTGSYPKLGINYYVDTFAAIVKLLPRSLSQGNPARIEQAFVNRNISPEFSIPLVSLSRHGDQYKLRARQKLLPY